MSLVPIRVTLFMPPTNIWLPVTPEKIEFSAGGGFAQYRIVDVGNVMIQRGRDVRRVKFSSFFPGPAMKPPSGASPIWLQKDAIFDPEAYILPILTTQEMGELGDCLLVVAGASYATMKCFIQDFQSFQQGGVGNVYYTITLVERRKLNTNLLTAAEAPTTTSAVAQQDTVTPLPDVRTGNPATDPGAVSAPQTPPPNLGGVGGLHR